MIMDNSILENMFKTHTAPQQQAANKTVVSITDLIGMPTNQPHIQQMPQPMMPAMTQPVVIFPQQIQHEYQWQYIDLKGICRGPFSQAAMYKWYMNAQLPANLKIKLFG